MKHITRLSKRILSLILLVSIAAALTGCGIFASKDDSKTEGLERFDTYFDDCFNTGISIIAYCDSEENFNQLASLAHEMFLAYHESCDIYNNYGSPNAYTLNEEKTVPIDGDGLLAEVIEASAEYYKITDGKTNIAMGSVLSLWHDVRTLANESDENTTINLPSDEELQAASMHMSFDDLVVDRTQGTIVLKDAEMSIDLGAVAKGYTTNVVGNAIKESGLSSCFMINSGGNCYCCGTKPDGNSWVIGVQNPEDLSGDYVEKLALSDLCVATSGDYYRYFELDGVRYCHIIDPDTLYPANEFRSVTVISPDAGLCDALSTALFVCSTEEGKEILANAGNAAAMWIRADGTKEYSDGFETYIK